MKLAASNDLPDGAPNPDIQAVEDLSVDSQMVSTPQQEDTGARSEDVEEEPSEEERRHLRPWLYALAAVGIVLLGAGREPWSRAVALILMGSVILISPPRIKLRLLPTVCLLVLAVAPGISLLPASMLGGVEVWRERLATEWGLDSGTCFSPEWRLTLEAWIMNIVGVAWFWSCLAQNFSSAGLRIVLRIVCLAVIIIAVMTLLDHIGWMRIPWWPHSNKVVTGVTNTANFGPFANPNHSSSLFAWVCVLCAAATFDAFKKRSRWWMPCLLGIPLLFACIMSNTSRAGLLLFILGISMWLAIAAMKRGVMRKIVVALAVAGLVISVVMVSGVILGDQFRQQPLSSALSSDLRVWLARQTLMAASYAPWVGRGLGTFDHVFPHVSTGASPDTRTIHPESDVFWLLFEGGLLMLIPCLLLLGWLARTSGPWLSSGRKNRSHDSRAARRMRRAFGIASGLALLHSTFDVPLHGLGYFALFALITALAVRGRYLSDRIQPWAVWAFRSLGLLTILWGGFWLAFAADWIEPAPATAGHKLHDRILHQSSLGNRAESMRLVEKAISLTPLDFRWYYLRAQLHLILKRDSDRALQDFGRSRALEPHYGPMCFDEGRYWLSFDPLMALIPWQEGMRRYPQQFENAMPLYQDIILDSAAYPEVNRALWKLADRPSLKLLFMSKPTCSEDMWQKCLADFLIEHPGLTGLSKQQILYFLYLCEHKGSAQTVTVLLEKYTYLQSLAWQFTARQLSQSGKFAEAYQLALRHLPPVVRSAVVTAADLPRLERVFVMNPVDPLPGVELFYAQRAKGDLKSARFTLEKVMALPNAPAFLKREMAELQAASGDMRGAWEITRSVIESMKTEMSASDGSTGSYYIANPAVPRARGTELEEAARDN